MRKKENFLLLLPKLVIFEFLPPLLFVSAGIFLLAALFRDENLHPGGYNSLGLPFLIGSLFFGAAVFLKVFKKSVLD